MKKYEAIELGTTVLKAYGLLSDASRMLLRQEDFIHNDEMWKLWQSIGSLQDKAFKLYQKCDVFRNKLEY